MPIEAGARLGPYEVLSAIGAGGMGEVYRARDRRLERDVAIKILPTQFSAGSRQLQRFEREARLLAALSHPNICSIYDVGTERGISFIVMEHLLGETLGARIQRGPIAIDVAIRYAIQIIDGLRVAHEQGLIHRDIKPGNIMITTTGLKLLDFGLAKRRASDMLDQPTPGHTGDTTRPSDLSAHEGIVGTLHYMAPEQLAGSDVDARSDIWAFGCVLFEMITGRRCFQGKTFSDVISGIMADRPVVMTLDRGGLPPVALQHIVTRCLARNPADRWQSSTEVWRELFALLKQNPSDAVPAASGSTSAYAGPASGAAPTSNSDTVFQALTSKSGSSASGRFPPVQMPEPPPPEPQKSGLGKVWIGIAALVVVLTAGVGAWWWFNGRAPELTKVAILPFAIGDGGADAAYLGGGLAGGVASELSRVAKLEVRPTGASSRATGTPEEVGRSLGVNRVVTGRVSLHDERIDVEATLVEAGTGTVLWTGRFAEPPAALVSLQREVIHGVLKGLHLENNAEEIPLASIPSTLHADAYRLFLRGRQAASLGTESSLRNAVELFNEAIAKDTNAAAAHAGLAAAYSQLASAMMAAVRPGDAFPKVKQATLRALEIDPGLAETRISLGVSKSLYDWDWQNAGAEFDRAIQLRPGDPLARERHADWLMSMGRPTDAVAEARKAVELDPKSVSANLTLGSHLFLARQYADAIEQLKATLALEPGSAAARCLLGQAYLSSGRPDEALKELQQASTGSGDKPVFQAALAYGQARASHAPDARQVLTRLQARAAKEYVSPYDLALVFVALDDRDAAFAQLEKAVADHAAGVALIAADPRLDPLRNDPRFRPLQQRVGV